MASIVLETSKCCYISPSFCKLFLCVENVDQESAIVCILYRVHIMVPVSGKDSNIIIIPLLSLVDIYILHSQM